jgi:putative transposase
MSRNYKFHNKEGIYFVTFAVIDWIDLFTRQVYSDIVVDALDYSRKFNGMVINGWCLMPSHVHLIFAVRENNPEKILGRLKEFTSKKIRKEIESNPEESRKVWLLERMKNAAQKQSNVKNYQLWQHHNKPVELWSNLVIDQKLDYIHNNPVEAGYVNEPHHWRYSSASAYAGEDGILKIDFL